MRTTLKTTFLITALGVPIGAWAQSGEGHDLLKLGFASLDQSNRGYVDQGEFLSFGNDVFVSMDQNQDDKISLGEFLSWGFGVELVAENAGRSDGYETAMRVVFAFWDRDGDNEITSTELSKSLAADFRRADSNNDAVLTEEEFLGGFSINIAARAAINPPAVE